MSNLAQVAGGIVGGVIGFFVGGPTGALYGAQIGIGVGSLVDPTQLPGVTGPRLGDNRTTTARVGDPVAQVFGEDAVGGTVIYVGPVNEVSNTESQGGKGGPEQNVTTFTYFQTIAIGLSRGPMGGIRQIFENGKLMYDASAQADGETDAAFTDRLTANAAYEATFQLYLGGEDQLPDPTIEAERGELPTPAYRGLMYLVFPERQLQQEQGLRHPTFKFVIFDTAQIECVDLSLYDSVTVAPWVPDSLDPRSPLGLQTDAYGYKLFSYSGGGLGDATEYGSIADALAAFQGLVEASPSSFTNTAFVNSLHTMTLACAGGLSGILSEDIAHLYPFDSDGYPRQGDLQASMRYSEMVIPGAGYFEALPLFADVLAAGAVNASNPGQVRSISNYPGATCLMPTVDAFTKLDTGYATAHYTNEIVDDLEVYYFPYLAISVRRYPTAPVPFCERAGATPVPGYADLCNYNGTLYRADDFVLTSGSFLALQRYEEFVDDTASFFVGPVITTTDPDNTEAFWTAQYEAAVAAGTLQPGKVYGEDYPESISEAYLLESQTCTVLPGDVPLANIVASICRQCGLADENFDVTDLAGKTVHGYQINRIADGRSCIDPLRSVGYFDYVESGRKIKFVARGKAPVRTLAQSDLGAHNDGEQAPPASTTSKAEDAELPRQVRVHYRAPSRDFEDGEQLSPTRVITRAVNDLDLDCPVAMSDQLAAEVAEVQWATAWAERWTHSTVLDQSASDLEPADVVVIPIDGQLERVRIIDINDSVPCLRRLNLVRDDDGHYEPVAVSEVPQRPPATVTIYSASVLLMLDLPPLRVEDDNPGIYIMARPQNATRTWRGVQIFHSADSGVTFPAESAITTAGTIGTTDAPLAAPLSGGDTFVTEDGDTFVTEDGDTFVTEDSAPVLDPANTWDDVNEILVTLSSGAFESHTESEVMDDGANLVAIGADGRWLLVGFTTAEQIGPNQWRLSHLLQGRRGTEYLIGTSETGDAIALVSGAGIVRSSLSNAQIGVEQIYKAVSIGTPVSTGIDYPFTSHGRALFPFSGVDLESVFDTANDIELGWTRRDRLGQELAPVGPTPMSEAAESYEIDIYATDSPPTFVRTLTSSTPAATYTAAQQTTDLGGLAANVYVKIYQISGVVGRGVVLAGFVSS